MSKVSYQSLRTILFSSLYYKTTILCTCNFAPIIRIEHANKMGIVNPLKREKNLPILFFDDGRKMSVLEGLEVYDILSLYASITKRCVITVSCLLIGKTLDQKSSQVKRTLEKNVLYKLR